MKTNHNLPVVEEAKAVYKIVYNTGKNKTIEVSLTHGFFIKESRNVRNFYDLNKIIGDNGLKLKSVKGLIQYLELTNEDFANIAGVSSRTVSRWTDLSPIGVLPSKTLVKIDEIVAKGVEVFGNEKTFKEWLRQSNTALGDKIPLELLITPYGTELVEDALDALFYGNVM